MGQQHPRPIGADQPGAAGEMAGQPVTQERVFRVVQQCAEFVSQGGVFGVPAGVIGQLAAQGGVKCYNGFRV